MSWIESHDTLARHPKTRRLMRALDISLPQAVGHLHLLWWWAMDFAPDGELRGYTATDLADAAMWSGEPKTFLSALIDAQFIDANLYHQAARIHNWGKYAGTAAKRRRAAELYGYNNPDWTAIRQQVIARDGYVCGICGTGVLPDDVHIDHIRPRSKGGSDTLDNLRVAHSLCNQRRGNREDGLQV